MHMYLLAYDAPSAIFSTARRGQHAHPLVTRSVVSAYQEGETPTVQNLNTRLVFAYVISVCVCGGGVSFMQVL